LLYQENDGDENADGDRDERPDDEKQARGRSLAPSTSHGSEESHRRGCVPAPPEWKPPAARDLDAFGPAAGR
jgi:hypothetical protein